MRTIILSAITLLLISCGTNKAVYQSPDFEHKTARHKVVAILPVRMIQTGHVARDIPEDVKESNEKLGYVFQESLQSFILRETMKNKKGQMVSFQSCLLHSMANLCRHRDTFSKVVCCQPHRTKSN